LKWLKYNHKLKGFFNKKFDDFFYQVSNLMFVNPEEEVFAENAELSFQFEIDNIYGDIQYRKMLLLTSNQFQKSMKEIESF